MTWLHNLKWHQINIIPCIDQLLFYSRKLFFQLAIFYGFARNSRRGLFLNIVFIRFIRKAEYNKTGSKNLRFLLPVICLFILLLLFFTFPRQPMKASCMAATALSASLRSIRTEIFISEVLIMWIFAPTE